MDFVINKKFKNHSLTLESAFSEEKFRIFYELYVDIFSDEEDYIFSYDRFKKWFNEETDFILPLIGSIDGEYALFRYINFDIPSKMAYIPCGGIIKKFRGQSIYPYFCEISEVILKEKGINFILNECEDPNKVETKDIAQKRLKMFIDKLGYSFVSKEKIPYLRNELPDEKNGENIEKIQDYYILGFKRLDKIRAKKISKSLYLKMYNKLRDFEFMFDQEKYINLPAVVKFNAELNNYKEKNIDLLKIHNYAAN